MPNTTASVHTTDIEGSDSHFSTEKGHESNCSLELSNAKASHSTSSVESEHFSIHAEQSILTVDMNGTWNEEDTLDYVESFKRLVNRYFTREWACVINLQGLDMLLSESFQIETLKALNAWSYIKGMKAISVIISEGNRSHLLYQFEEIFKVNHPYATAVCHSDISASQWLASQGFKPKFANPSHSLESIAV